MEDKPKTVDEIKIEIDQLTASIIGKINKCDSKRDVADITQTVLNTVIAKVDLSKLEKAGILVYLTNKRTM